MDIEGWKEVLANLIIYTIHVIIDIHLIIKISVRGKNQQRYNGIWCIIRVV